MPGFWSASRRRAKAGSDVTCTACEGLGLVRTEKGMRPCDCQRPLEVAWRLSRAGLPAGFRAATLENFRVAAHTGKALLMAKRFVEEFMPGSGNDRPPGLLLTGSVGVGKTHLACAMARALVEQKNIEARFVDVRELLDRLRSSYGQDAGESHAAILKPLVSADLVVIDELGAARPSDWVFETIELLIGGLYNRMTPLIVTTNLANLNAGAGGGGNEYARAARAETLGDRIGARMWSRLQQMCVALDMTGPDFRGRR